MNIEKEVRNFLTKIKGPITYGSVEKYIKGKGYNVIIFDDNTNEIHALGLDEIANKYLAFTYKDNINIIFIHRSCTEYQKLQLLLHEIGHIELKHFDYYTLNSDEKEYQANRFAQIIIQNASNKETKAKRVFIAFLFLAAIATGTLVGVVLHKKTPR